MYAYGMINILIVSQLYITKAILLITRHIISNMI